MRKISIGFATIVLGLVAVFGYAQAPVPFISQPLVPDATAPGGPQFTLTVNGTGFVSNSTVNWNTTPLATTFISGSKLTAIVPAADIATASTGWVTVVNPAPGGGTSNMAFVTVTGNTGNSAAFNLASSPVVGFNPASVAAGDFNEDGELDLAVANACGTDPTCKSPGSVSILLGDGKGNFTLASSPATGMWPYAVAVGDFNGDGKLDLAVVNTCGDDPSCVSAGTVSVFLGDGAGNFTLASSLPAGSRPQSVVVGDFNGDGTLDLAVANTSSNTVSILLGDGTGNFTLVSSIADVEPNSIAVGDFNLDGKLDLAVASGSGTVSVFLGDGSANFTLASQPAAGASPWSIAAGDFNGDGKLDLAVVNFYSNTVSVLLGDGTGNFTAAPSPLTAEYCDAVAVGDFNGDGKLDLAVVNEDDEVFILLGDGTGNFTVVPSWVYGEPYALAVGDFNGDGKLDLGIANFGLTSGISILLQGSPAATLSPASLSFGTQLLGTTSTPQTVTLTSSGTAALTITSITASANFSETNNCGPYRAAGSSCTISATFTPLGVGMLTGSVTITDDASNSPQTISLTGTGTVASLLPGSLKFGVLKVGTSLTRTATLTNYSYRTLDISLIRFLPPAAGDFAQTNTCGTSVPAQSSCTFSITFTPQAKGSRKSTMAVIDNGGGGQQKVALSGTGM